MTDIALVQDADGRLDVAIETGDLTADESLRTAVILSLMLDRRANADDELPHGGTDRRGWWADAYSEPPEDLVGSRLWLLSREKDLPDVRRRAEAYAREALQWLLDDGIAESIEVEAETVQRGWLGLLVTIRRPGGGTVEQRYDYAWEAL
jgi:phage gp46-like protein